MTFFFPIGNVDFEISIPYNNLNGALVAALVERGMGSDREVEYYVPMVRGHLVDVGLYPTSIESPIDNIKNYSDYEIAWEELRPHAVAGTARLEPGARAAYLAHLRTVDRAVCLSQPVQDNFRDKGAGSWRFRIVRQYLEASAPRIDVFLETGTFKGEMLEAMKDAFPVIISIELDAELAEKARRKYAGDHPNIHVVTGDSLTRLKEVLTFLDRPAIFWLDAHWEGGVMSSNLQSPVLAELRAILTHRVRDHVVLIDDGRVMNGGKFCYNEDWNGRNLCGWPSIREIQEFVCELRPEMMFYLADDIVRVHPRKWMAGPTHGS